MVLHNALRATPDDTKPVESATTIFVEDSSVHTALRRPDNADGSNSLVVDLWGMAYLLAVE